jgi:ABC-type sugar transport system permease subunit
MMFLLAGLKNIDTSIYESAKIDGANWFLTIIKITLPMIKRVLLFVFVANTSTNILLFVPMQMITMGGPEGSTNVLMYEAYKSAFKFADRPRSAVMVTALLLVIIVICLGQFKLLNEKDSKAF